MSTRGAGVSFLKQERQRHLDAIAAIDSTLSAVGAAVQRRRGGGRDRMAAAHAALAKKRAANKTPAAEYATKATAARGVRPSASPIAQARAKRVAAASAGAGASLAAAAE